MRIVPLDDIPLFNPDREQENISAVKGLKSHLSDADGLIIASPEYAHGISGVMKNALDWLVSGEEFVNLPIMLINTSPRAEHAQKMLREIVTTMSGQIIEESCVSIGLLGSQLDAQGIIQCQHLSNTLTSSLEAFYSGIANDVSY